MDKLLINKGDKLICLRRLDHNGRRLFLVGNTYTVSEGENNGRLTIIGEGDNTVKLPTFIALNYLNIVKQSRKDRIQNLGL